MAQSPPTIRPQLFYDAEYDLGLVADDSSDATATSNTTKLNAALNAQSRVDTFAFSHLPTGPVVRPILFPGKAFYFKGHIETNTRMGGGLYGVGGGSYFMLPSEYSTNGVYGGAVTRFYRIDGQNGGPMLRIRGVGFRVEGIEFNGRPWIANNGLETGFGSYQRTHIAIEFEGRAVPATGQHAVRNCAVTECDYALCARAGYYDSNTDNGVDPFTGSNPGFVSDENHADQTAIDNLVCFGCRSVFRSENQQAVCWSFKDIYVNGFQYTPTDGRAVIIFDIMRGGDVVANNVIINNSATTVLKVRDFSVNTCKYTINDIKQDGGLSGSSYLTLFEMDDSTNQWTSYVGSTSMNLVNWPVRMTGRISNNSTDYDYSKLVVIPAGLVAKGVVRSDLLFDIYRLPMTNFTRVGSGPWATPA